ncbi:MAG: hypothetical protein ACRCYS_01185 [Beijerinckiaceae bacterium]
MKVEFSEEILAGGKPVTSIEVRPLRFVEMVAIWARVDKSPLKPMIALNRERLRHQVHFLAADNTRLIPGEPELNQLPAKLAKQLLGLLDEGQGDLGKVINEGDGTSIPILYKLGTAIEIKSGKDGASLITELEFKASTFGETEDILAAGSEPAQALALLNIAKPVEIESLQRLPGWAIDKITTADGLGIMKFVLPNF